MWKSGSKWYRVKKEYQKSTLLYHILIAITYWEKKEITKNEFCKFLNSVDDQERKGAEPLSYYWKVKMIFLFLKQSLDRLKNLYLMRSDFSSRAALFAYSLVDYATSL
jgi:hypothetical protein